MKFFTLSELTHSDTATARKIDNTPTADHVAHLQELVAELLDPLREAWGDYCQRHGATKPGIRVSSGYRGFRLNAAVRGAASSAHCQGYAADLIPLNGDLRGFKACCREFLADRNFDQMISESEDASGTPVWIHLGLRDGRGAQRRQLLTMRGGRYLPMT